MLRKKLDFGRTFCMLGMHDVNWFAPADNRYCRRPNCNHKIPSVYAMRLASEHQRAQERHAMPDLDTETPEHLQIPSSQPADIFLEDPGYSSVVLALLDAQGTLLRTDPPQRIDAESPYFRMEVPPLAPGEYRIRITVYLPTGLTEVSWKQLTIVSPAPVAP